MSQNIVKSSFKMRLLTVVKKYHYKVDIITVSMREVDDVREVPTSFSYDRKVTIDSDSRHKYQLGKHKRLCCKRAQLVVGLNANSSIGVSQKERCFELSIKVELLVILADFYRKWVSVGGPNDFSRCRKKL